MVLASIIPNSRPNGLIRTVLYAVCVCVVSVRPYPADANNKKCINRIVVDAPGVGVGYRFPPCHVVCVFNLRASTQSLFSADCFGGGRWPPAAGVGVVDSITTAHAI